MNIECKDKNFRLAIIQVLMYELCLIPEFDLDNFLEGKNIPLDEVGYEKVPEILTYFDSITLTEEMLAQIEEIYQDGGNQIYLDVCPDWDGEDDQFNIQHVDDVKWLPNLKKITLFYDDDEVMVEKFKNVGINAEYL